MPAKPYTLDSIIEWAEARSPDETYRWASDSDCFMARYAKSQGDHGGYGPASNKLYLSEGDSRYSIISGIYLGLGLGPKMELRMGDTLDQLKAFRIRSKKETRH